MLANILLRGFMRVLLRGTAAVWCVRVLLEWNACEYCCGDLCGTAAVECMWVLLLLGCMWVLLLLCNMCIAACCGYYNWNLFLFGAVQNINFDKNEKKN